MVMAEHSQVWVGSEDSVIYIINVHSMSCNKQLTDHRSPVTGLAVHNGKKPRYQGPMGQERGKACLPGVWMVRGPGLLARQTVCGRRHVWSGSACG